MPNPFVLGNNNLTTQQFNTQNEFREYAWDFNRNCFIYNPDGTQKIVTRNEALKVWVYKTLLTERYRYGAYFDDYGLELEQFIGKKPNDETESNVLYQAVKEALLVNTYILSVDNVFVEREHKKVTLTITLITIYGKTTLGIEV